MEILSPILRSLFLIAILFAPLSHCAHFTFAKTPFNTVDTLCTNDILDITQFNCVVKCSRDHLCLGFSRSSNAQPNSRDTCILHVIFPRCTAAERTNFSTAQVYYEKHRTCANNGRWMADQQRCNCSNTNGWVGKTCSDAPVSCYDLFLAGYSRGTHTISRSHVPSLGSEILLCNSNVGM